MSAKTTKQLQRDFEDNFSRIGSFDGTFSLQVKPDSKQYQASPSHVDYVLQKPSQEKFK